MQGLSNSYAFWIILFAVIIAVYMLPTLIGLIRGVDRMALVLLVNLIGAPSGIGWIAAMILAFGPRRSPCGLARPQVPRAVRGPAGAARLRPEHPLDA